MNTEYIQRIVNLEPSDYQAVKRCAQEKGFGGKGFSAALRLIIREWEAGHQEPCHPRSPILDPIASISAKGFSITLFVCCGPQHITRESQAGHHQPCHSKSPILSRIAKIFGQGFSAALRVCSGPQRIIPEWQAGRRPPANPTSPIPNPKSTINNP